MKITDEIEMRVKRVLDSDMSTYEIANRLDYKSHGRIGELRKDIKMIDRFTYKIIRGLLEIENEMGE